MNTIILRPGATRTSYIPRDSRYRRGIRPGDTVILAGDDARLTIKAIWGDVVALADACGQTLKASFDQLSRALGLSKGLYPLGPPPGSKAVKQTGTGRIAPAIELEPEDDTQDYHCNAAYLADDMSPDEDDILEAIDTLPAPEALAYEATTSPYLFVGERDTTVTYPDAWYATSQRSLVAPTPEPMRSSPHPLPAPKVALPTMTPVPTKVQGMDVLKAIELAFLQGALTPDEARKARSSVSASMTLRQGRLLLAMRHGKAPVEELSTEAGLYAQRHASLRTLSA